MPKTSDNGFTQWNNPSFLMPCFQLFTLTTTVHIHHFDHTLKDSKKAKQTIDVNDLLSSIP